MVPRGARRRRRVNARAGTVGAASPPDRRPPALLGPGVRTLRLADVAGRSHLPVVRTARPRAGPRRLRLSMRPCSSRPPTASPTPTRCSRSRPASAFVAGVVGWVPLGDPAAAERELEARAGRLCGVRHLVHREADPDGSSGPRVQPGLGMLAEHLTPVRCRGRVSGPPPARAADRRASPRTSPLVIDHLAKPPFRRTGGTSGFASCEPRPPTRTWWPSCQAWTPPPDPAGTRPSSAPRRRRARGVGPKRGCCSAATGLSRPVSGYGDVVRATEQLIAALTPDERAQVMGGTATRLYGIGT